MQTDWSLRWLLFDMGGNNDITYEWHFIRASVGTPADARFVPELG